MRNKVRSSHTIVTFTIPGPGQNRLPRRQCHSDFFRFELSSISSSLILSPFAQSCCLAREGIRPHPFAQSCCMAREGIRPPKLWQARCPCELPKPFHKEPVGYTCELPKEGAIYTAAKGSKKRTLPVRTLPIRTLPAVIDFCLFVA